MDQLNTIDVIKAVEEIVENYGSFYPPITDAAAALFDKLGVNPDDFASQKLLVELHIPASEKIDAGFTALKQFVESRGYGVLSYVADVRDIEPLTGYTA